MEEDDLHLSRIQTLWSMVHRAHGDHTAVQSAQQTLLDRYGGAVRRYALAALRDEDAADEVFQEFALKFVRRGFGQCRSGAGRFPGVRQNGGLSANRGLPASRQEAAAGIADAFQRGRAARG